MCQPESHSAVPQRKPRLSRLVVTLVLLAAIVVTMLLWGMVYLWRTGCERRCRRELKGVLCALIDRVIASGGRLPCAYVMDSSGRRMHSWRPMIIWRVDSAYAGSLPLRVRQTVG